jgi:quinol monooxygenase YgiN
MINVLAIITAKPGRLADVLQAVAANLSNVRAEKGCIEYAPSIDAAGASGKGLLGPDTFVMIEKWETMDDLKAHAASAHMAAYAAKTRDLLENRLIHILEPAAL